MDPRSALSISSHAEAQPFLSYCCFFKLEAKGMDGTHLSNLTLQLILVQLDTVLRNKQNSQTLKINKESFQQKRKKKQNVLPARVH